MQAVIEYVGLSTVSNIVAITRYCMDRRRSEVDKAVLAKASVAFLLASLNLSLALDSAPDADALRSPISSSLIPFVRVNVSAAQVIAVAACVVVTALLFSPLGLASSNISYKNLIPSLKKLILANKSFLANPSSFDLISLISRMMKSRHF